MLLYKTKNLYINNLTLATINHEFNSIQFNYMNQHERRCKFNNKEDFWTPLHMPNTYLFFVFTWRSKEK